MRASWILGNVRKLNLNTLGSSYIAPVENLANVAVPVPKPAPPKGGDMMRYIVKVMASYPEAVVLTQVGSFYEMYFEHAVEYGPKLNLKIARKRQQSPRDDLPFVNMAGFPLYQLERYLKPLVQNFGKTVVLLDQDQRKIFNSNVEAEKRPIARIITPGTLVSESFIDAWKHNYLAAIQFTSAHLEALRSKKLPAKDIPADSPVGLAWVDLSEGSFHFQTTTFGSLANDLMRINPNEVLLDTAAEKFVRAYPKMFEPLDLERFSVSYTKFPPGESLINYADHFDQSTTSVNYKMDLMGPRARNACSALMSYVEEHLPGTTIRFQLPEEYIASTVMQIDGRSRDGLELFQSNTRDSTRGSFFNVIRRTITPSGSRLLEEWLTSPLQDIDQINDRLDIVEFFVKNPTLSEDFRGLLHHQPDGKRIIQRLSMKKLDAYDLLGFSQSIEGLQKFLELIEKHNITLFSPWAETLRTSLIESSKIARKIAKSINIDNIIARSTSPDEQKDTSIVSTAKDSFARMNSNYNPVLWPNVSKKLRDLYQTQEKFAEKSAEILEKTKAEYSDVAKASIRWTPLFSYHIHLKLARPIDLPAEKVLSRTKKTASLMDPELSKLGSEREAFYSNLEILENEFLEDLRKKALSCTEEVRKGLNIVDLVDVTQSLARLASELQMVRPNLTDEPILDIKDGRHIVVETGLQLTGGNFEGNDCNLNTEVPICMVTGPNMGGKSTYIRQVATIALLGHIGSFVPASEATIGIVDRIFCRIGAGDDLFRGRSTFMMEMLETSSILRNATNRSLAILDEVGRGTSGQDGLAIAYGAIKHLVEVNQCRGLFATHFGNELFSVLNENELADRLSCLTSHVSEDDGDISFHYKLRPGVSQASHGLLIAKLADFPIKALNDAQSLIDY